MSLFKILRQSERETKTSSFLQPFDFHETIKRISYGKAHIVFVTKRNEMYVYGDNSYGQLGLKNIDSTFEFKTVVNWFNIKLIECGYYFTILLNENNELYFTGLLTNIFKSKIFTKIKFYAMDGNEKFTKIKCGSNFVFVFTNKYLYGMGQNECGQLGLKRMPNVNSLSCIKTVNVDNILDLQCGSSHSVLLTKTKDVYITGSNRCLQFGKNSDDKDSFTKIDLDFKVNKIACGLESTFILNDNNELYVAGRNRSGELGLNNSDSVIFTKVNINNINNIYGSLGSYTMLISYDNELMVSGENNDEKLGIKERFCKCTFDGYFLYQFTKIEIPKEFKKKFFHPLLLTSNIYLLYLDYNVNNDDDITHQNNLFTQPPRGQFSDLLIYFK